MARNVENADERRARLVGIARDVIAREGVAACTFRRLAAAAGTSTRPFTHAFATRDNLLRAVAFSTWEGSEVDVTAPPAALDLPADWDCIDALLAIGAHWLPVSEERALSERIYFEITLFALTRPELHEELLAFSYTANRRFAALIAEGQARGQVRTDSSADELAMAFVAYQAGVAFAAIYEPEALPPAMVHTIWRAGLERILRPA